MSGFNPYNNPPQDPPPQNQINPNIYNHANAPPPGQSGQQPPQPYPYQPGFAYAYPRQPGPGVAPTAPYPGQGGMAPTAPGMAPSAQAAFSYPGYPGVTPQQPGHRCPVEWIPSTPRDAGSLSDRAVVGGHEGYDGSPLWVIRACYEGDLIPGKYPAKYHVAYVPWGGNENAVQNIEVCCARPERIRWVQGNAGSVPRNAVVGGNTASGEPLYVGRAKFEGSVTPGKVQPSHKTMYISYAGSEIACNNYEVLCTIY